MHEIFCTEIRTVYAEDYFYTLYNSEKIQFVDVQIFQKISAKMMKVK